MQQDYLQAIAAINQVSDIAIQHWRNMKIDTAQFTSTIPNYFSFLVQNLFECLTELSENKMQNLVPHLTIGSVVFSFDEFKESIRNGSQELALTVQASIVKHLDEATSSVKEWLKQNGTFFDENVINLRDFVLMKFRSLRVARSLINIRVMLNEFDSVYVIVRNSDLSSKTVLP